MFEKKGCQVVAWIIGVLFIIGMLNNGTCMGLGSAFGGKAADASTAIATVDGQPVSAEALEAALAQSSNQATGNPLSDFYNQIGAVNSAIDLTALETLAKAKKAEVTPTLIKETIERDWAQVVESFKSQMVQQKVLKPNATEKEFEDAFKKARDGMTPLQFKEQRIKELSSQLQDPAEGAKVRQQFLYSAVLNVYQLSSAATIDDYKKSTESFNFKRIRFDDPKKTADQNKSEAEKALAEINAGAKFDDVHAKYNKGRDNGPMPIGRQFFDAVETMKPLANLKPGETSKVMMQGTSATIYHLVDIKPNLPSDFDKKKDTYLKDFQKIQASQTLTKDLDAIKKDKIKWNDEAIGEAYKAFKSGNDTYKLSPEEAIKSLKETYGRLKMVKATTPFGERLGILARYFVFQDYYNRLKADQKKELNEDQITVLQEVLQQSESSTVRLQLFDALVEAGNFEEAGEALIEAARNISGSDAMSAGASRDIKAKADKAEKDGKIAKEAIESVRKELARWEKERIEEEKASKEANKSASDVDKELDKLDDPDAKKKSGSSTTGK